MRALSWAGIYWQPLAPGITSLLAERGARIPGYWPFTYVPLKRLPEYIGRPSKRAVIEGIAFDIGVKINDFF